MLSIFSDMVEQFLEVFMDDVTVFGNSFDDCLENLDMVLKRCDELEKKIAHLEHAEAALALASGCDARSAAELANYAAGVVVKQLGTATVSAEELNAALSE